jgi:methylase of polypeptide subunit release factors
VDYLHGVKETEKPRYILVSDFDRFVLYNLEDGTQAELTLAEFPQRIELFDFIAGYEVRTVREQDPVNIRAAELMGKLHDEMKANGYDGQALEVYLVRLLFILFADDTGIFERDAFYNFIVDQSREDGTDLGPQLARIFQLLNTAEDKRPKNLDERLADFKYINGKLFAEPLPLAEWDGAMRVTLLELASLDWAAISPAIFGALFQSAMDPKQRRNLGAHYTSEQNILKLIKPLFLDELWDEFEKVKSNAAKLDKFHHKLSELRFLDPACGCGNFLVITYRELRELEVAVIKASLKGQQVVDVDNLVLLNVDRFYGIEIEEFPAQIAQVAMWLMDHQMNQMVSAAFGEYMVRIPLRSSATIACDNALRRDWQGLLPEGKRFDFILGNPPFIGSKLMTEDMRTDIHNAFPDVKGAGTLDFVCGWYGLAARYMLAHGGKHTRSAFVSTNSITQGEQVAALWGPLLAKGIKIHFAHQTFRWNNEARGVAAVHCVIVGFADFDKERKRLYTYTDPRAEAVEEVVRNISPYLVESRDVVITSRSKPLCVVPEIVFGSMPNDGGGLIIEDEDYKAFLQAEPAARKFVRPFVGAEEYINKKLRWCLWLKDASPTELRTLPLVRARVEQVRKHRLASGRDATKRLASTPQLFGENRQPTTTYVVIPSVSSERRLFVPMGFLKPSTIASNLCLIVPGAGLYHFGMLTSTMHNAWLRYIGGRLESRYRYSNKIVYNNYPWPEQPTAAQKQAVEAAAQGVLDARAAHPGASLADLYDPLTMPPDLVKAHHTLDKAVDKCYRAQAFTTDAKRVEYLFELYEKYTKGLLAGEKGKKSDRT